jgi:ArsR family transcriptional regulator, arsenate/arsenite/antimonite-responsive transcriptional repressor
MAGQGVRRESQANHSAHVNEEQMVTLTTPSQESTSSSPVPAHNGQGGASELATLALGTARDLVQLFKLLADETRLRILHYLMQTEELNVRTFCSLLDQSQPAVSHHLALLKEAGVIECRRDGKHNFYHLVPKRCQVFLDTVFGVSGQETRKVRIENALLTYGRDVLSE